MASAASTAAAALPPEVVLTRVLPANAQRPGDVRDGSPEPTRVAAFLRLRRPSCPPCPPGAECEPCPPPFHQLAEVPATQRTYRGPVVFADFVMPSPSLAIDVPYVFEGRFESHSDGPAGKSTVLAVQRIHRLDPALAARVAVQLSPLNLDRHCTVDADCRLVDRWPAGFERCCRKCPSDAVNLAASKRASDVCQAASDDGCPSYAACAVGGPLCANGRCTAR